MKLVVSEGGNQLVSRFLCQCLKTHAKIWSDHDRPPRSRPYLRASMPTCRHSVSTPSDSISRLQFRLDTRRDRWCDSDGDQKGCQHHASVSCLVRSPQDNSSRLDRSWLVPFNQLDLSRNPRITTAAYVSGSAYISGFRAHDSEFFRRWSVEFSSNSLRSPPPIASCPPSSRIAPGCPKSAPRPRFHQPSTRPNPSAQ